MDEVEKIVLKMVGSRYNQNQYNLFKLKSCWREIAGAVNAKHCSPVKLERRVLFLKVDSSVWSNQLLYYKGEILAKINQFLEDNYIKDIKFILGQGFQNVARPAVYSSKTECLQVPSVTPAEEKGLQSYFSHINDEHLREAIIRVEEKKLGLEKLYAKGIVKKCPLCSAYLKNGEELCYVCQRKKKEELHYQVSRIISGEPWIKWTDLCKQVKCDKMLFNVIKNDLESYYFEKVRQDTATEQEKNIAVQLKAGKPLGLLSSEEFTNILGFLQKRDKKNVCTLGSRKFSAK